MRIQSFLVFAVAIGFVGAARADGLITKLPEDGTWATYTAKEIITFPNKKNAPPIVAEATLRIASVGSEKIDGAACRWIELTLDANAPGAKKPIVTIFKALIPEKYLAEGQDPRKHWLKGWMKVGDQPPQLLTKEQLSYAGLKLNLFVCGPLGETKPLPEKTIETELGKLTCKGVSGLLVVKGGWMVVINDQVKFLDLKIRMDQYAHEKAPFGVVSLRSQLLPGIAAAQGSISVSEVTLRSTGKGAKSVWPENK